MSTPEERRAARAKWPVRKLVRGEEPEDESLATTTAAERIGMMWRLSINAWTFLNDDRSEPTPRCCSAAAAPDDST